VHGLVNEESPARDTDAGTALDYGYHDRTTAGAQFAAQGYGENAKQHAKKHEVHPLYERIGGELQGADGIAH